MKTKEIKLKADKIIKYSDFKGSNFLRRMVDTNIKHKGYYSYTNENGEKILIES